MANLAINLNEILDARRKSQIVIPFGTKEDKKQIHLRVDAGDDEVKMYLDALNGKPEDAENDEEGEKASLKAALKALTNDEDKGLWDEFDDWAGGDAGVIVFRTIMTKVQDKFFEVKTGKESGDSK